MLVVGREGAIGRSELVAAVHVYVVVSVELCPVHTFIVHRETLK